VIPGETYYIVASADNGSQDNSYSWIRNEDDLYPDGEVYGAERGTNEWELREGDCCFVTYSPLAKEKTYNSIPRVIVWLFERFPFLQP
jgi:hypothetical protein